MKAKPSPPTPRRRRRRAVAAVPAEAEEESPDPVPEAADPAHPGHGAWLCRRVGRMLRRRRLTLGASAYELEVPGQLSDQAILNNERGQRSPGLLTLVRHCQRLGTTLRDLLPVPPDPD